MPGGGEARADPRRPELRRRNEPHRPLNLRIGSDLTRKPIPVAQHPQLITIKRRPRTRRERPAHGRTNLRGRILQIPLQRREWLRRREIHLAEIIVENGPTGRRDHIEEAGRQAHIERWIYAVSRIFCAAALGQPLTEIQHLVIAHGIGCRRRINPGIVETEGTVSAGFIGSDFEKALIEQTPLGYDSVAEPDRAFRELRDRYERAATGGSVLTEFTLSTRFAGRDVIAYRQHQPELNAEVDWYVLFDRDAQLSVGCQRTSAGADAVRAACAEVVGTLRARPHGVTGSR